MVRASGKVEVLGYVVDDMSSLRTRVGALSRRQPRRTVIRPTPRRRLLMGTDPPNRVMCITEQVDTRR
ncbi:hypothetical protein BKE56_007865 [Rhodococcus sp. M8]|nr:hypothetical protein BKE56_007865 [Rhodococcus sp. M8]